MKVKFLTPWFGPNAHLHPVGTHEIDDGWKELLPPSAQIIEEAAPIEDPSEPELSLDEVPPDTPKPAGKKDSVKL